MAQLYIRFSCTQSQPDLLGIFTANGGNVGDAAVPLDSDFAVTGCKQSFVLQADETSKDVRIELNMDELAVDESSSTVYLPSDARLLASTLRVGASIGGTLVNTVAGDGSQFVYHLLKEGSEHAQFGLTYKSWAQHAASVGVSGMRVCSLKPLDDNGKHPDDKVYNVVFKRRTDQVFKGKPIYSEKDVTSKLEESAQYIARYAEAAWKLRQMIVYPPSKMLTKSVFMDLVGVAGQKFCMLHDIVERGQPYSMETLDKMFESAISAELAQDSTRISAFLGATKEPGVLAATKAHAVAAATNFMVSFLVTYRSDGRNFVKPSGTGFVSVESWLRSVQRTPADANDCDGSALLAVGILNDVGKISAEEAALYPWINAVKNVVHPYYQVCIAVVGATAAEATSAGSAPTIAGHAIAMMLPSIGVLKAMEKAGGDHTVGVGEKTQRLLGDDEEKVAEARFKALFKNIEALPDREKSVLRNWTAAKTQEWNLPHLAVEGTVPAAPTLFTKDSSERSKDYEFAVKDDAAAKKIGANVMRAVKALHVGGKGSSPHRFYSEIVEITFPRSHPFWTDETIRELNVVASQYVLSKETASGSIDTAGATPKDIATESYMLVPLVSVHKQAAETFDFGSVDAARNVIPPRPKESVMKLTKFQSDAYKQSLAHFKELQQHFQSMPVTDDHSCMYLASFSTMIYNATSIKHFCDRLRKVAVNVQVDGLDTVIPGLAQTSDGEAAGSLVTVNCQIRV